jgi:hypothetical protein
MLFFFLILIALLIAQIGFWETLAALLGAVVMMILVVILGLAILGLAAYLFVKRRVDSVTRRLR